MTMRRAFVLLAWGLLAALPVTNEAVADAVQSAIQRGEYLATAGDCVSCHTADGGKPFAGGY